MDDAAVKSAAEKLLAQGYSADKIAALAQTYHWYQTAARPEQKIPLSGPWTKWLFLAGRGAGKTKSAAEWTWNIAYANSETYWHVVAPTWQDVIHVCFGGPSGIMSCMPFSLIKNWSVSDGILELKNGSIIRGFSAEKPDRLRGPQAHGAWFDELAAWQRAEETYDMAMFGLRLGSDVKIAMTTTPRPIPLVTQLLKEAEEPNSRTVVMRGSTYDNRANLAENFFDDLVAKYEGTRLGRQELYGEVISPLEQGIIKESWIQLWPHDKDLPAMRFIVLSLDTAFTEESRDKKTGERDYTACTVWGVFTRDDKRDCMMLLDCWQERLGMPELVKRVPKEMDIKYGNMIDPVVKPLFGDPLIKASLGGRRPDLCLIEDKGSGISLRQMLSHENLHAYPYNPGRAKKIERLHAVSHLFANGLIYVPESKKSIGRPMSWAETMIEQLCTFAGEGSIKHDDYVDSATQAIRYLADRNWITVVPRPAPTDEITSQRPQRNPYAS